MRWYRRAFTRYEASNKCEVRKTRYFRAKCVNITPKMALTAAALLQTSRYLVCNLFSCRSGAIFGMLTLRWGLSASARLSCITQFYQFNMSFLEILKLIHFGLCSQYQIPKFKWFGNWDDLIDQLKLESTQWRSKSTVHNFTCTDAQSDSM